MNHTIDTYIEWCEKIYDGGVNLNTWESDFIESVYGRLIAQRSISEKQAEILERIYAEKTP